jgi:hypothetical protein
MKLSPYQFALLGLLTVATAAQATTNGFFVPAWRGSASSETGYWENFSVANGAPGNLADRPGATTGAVLTQNTPGAFLTGTLNIYNMAGPSSFTLADSTPFALGNVLLQTYVQGAELNYGGMTLNYTDGSGSHSVAPLLSGELFRTSGGLGAVAYFWQWDLTGLAVTDYTLTFAASGVHSSFDAMTLDTAVQFSAVPEPTTAAFSVLAGVALLVRHRISRRSVKV